MKPASSCRDGSSEPLTELEELLTADQRRTVSVNDHAAFIASLAPKQPDGIDELVADLRAVEPNRELAR